MDQPRAYDVITVGSATEDIMIEVDSAKVITIEDINGSRSYMALEYGGKMHVDSIIVSVGGGGVNTAMTFALQGLTTAVVSKVGRDDGADRVRNRLTEAGAYAHLLADSADHSTGYSTIITSYSGERTVLVHRGASRELCAEDLDRDEMARTQWLYVGALAGNSWRLYPLLAEFARDHGIKLALNLGTSQIARGLDEFAEILSCADLLFQNAEEMQTLTGVPPERGDRDEREMMRQLHDVGVDVVVITDGAQGAAASDGSALYVVPAFEVEAACSLGAGDAFAAGCLSALQHGLDLQEALRMGAANSASVVQETGANRGILTWDEAREFVATHAPR
jgi:sugar/nucleoside kinase (ribokinase family)